MAKYDYNSLKKAAANGVRIGGWKDRNVYACSKYDYDATNADFYVIYDDGSKLVKQGYVYGTIMNSGAINECDHYWYNVPCRATDKVVRQVPASGYSADVIADEFFSKLDREINELLAGVAELKFD